MGIINKLSKRCVFCGSRVGTKYVPVFDMYREFVGGNWYHDKCLQEVACEPEKHERFVDLAIDIIKRIETMKRHEESAKERAEEACEYLKQQCVTK